MRRERRTRSRIAEQMRVLGPLAAAWSCGAAALLALLGNGPSSDARLLLDPAAVAGLPWYTGLISNLGVILWAVATVSAMSAARIARLGNRHGAAAYLTQGGGLSVLLLFDDLFQLHSAVLPELIGTPKSFVLLVYLTALAGWMLTNVEQVRRTRWMLLAASALALAVSIVIDQFAPGQTWSLIAEDSAKFLGIIAWALYFHLTGTDIAGSVVGSLRDDES